MIIIKNTLKALLISNESNILETTKNTLSSLNIDLELSIITPDFHHSHLTENNSFNVLIIDITSTTSAIKAEIQYNSKNRPHISVLLLTDHAKEKSAIEYMQNGAYDYFFKDNLKRLPFVLKHIVEKIPLQDYDKFKIYIDNSPSAMFVVNENGFYVDVNNAASEMTGYSKNELLSMHVSELFPPDEHYMEAFNKLITTGNWSGELPLIRKSGVRSYSQVNSIKLPENHYLSIRTDISKQIKSRNELKNRERLLSQMFNVIPIGLWLADKNGKLIHGNPAGINIWGAKPHASMEEYGIFKAKRLPSGEKIKADDWALVHTIKDGITIENELLEIEAFDGEKKIILNYTAPIFDENGDVQNAIIVNNDVTEWKKIELALFESENKYRLLADNTHDCIWIINLDLIFTYVNPWVHTMFGHYPEELIGKSIMKIMPEKSYTEIVNMSQKMLSKESDTTSVRFEAELLRKDANKITAEIIAATIYDENNEPIGFQGSARDITERKKTENAMKESEERLNLAMTAAEYGFWDLDLLSAEIFLSPAWFEVLGYSEDELEMTLSTWKDLMDPAQSDEWMEQITSTLNDSKPLYLEVRVKSKSEGWKWILVKGKTFELTSPAEGKRAVGTIVDITRRIKAEEKLMMARIAAEDANRFKNELLANVNHELKTPLNSIIGFSDILIDERVDSLTKTQKNYLQIVKDSGIKLLNVIEGLIHFSEIESNSINLKYEQVDVIEVINSVLDMTKVSAMKKDLSIDLSVQKNDIQFIGDKNKIREIIFNLIENAIKFTPTNGKICIEAGRKEEDLCISIIDNGIGIHEQFKDKIFEPFFQIDGSSTRRYNGTGLGLVVVKEYIKMHNGKIYVHSEPEKGSSFIVCIPFYPKKFDNQKYRNCLVTT